MPFHQDVIISIRTGGYFPWILAGGAGLLILLFFIPGWFKVRRRIAYWMEEIQKSPEFKIWLAANPLTVRSCCAGPFEWLARFSIPNPSGRALSQREIEILLSPDDLIQWTVFSGERTEQDRLMGANPRLRVSDREISIMVRLLLSADASWSVDTVVHQALYQLVALEQQLRKKGFSDPRPQTPFWRRSFGIETAVCAVFLILILPLFRWEPALATLLFACFGYYFWFLKGF